MAASRSNRHVNSMTPSFIGSRISRLALIVDRDADTRQLYAEYLRLSNWRVDETADGREALARAISLRPDVIVTDTRLPGMSGVALCRLLRQDVATSAIPVVFVTADAYAADVEQATAAGADGILTKPCLPDRLLAEMRRVLSSRGHAVARLTAPGPAAPRNLAKGDDLLSRAVATARRLTLKKAHRRGDTLNPPLTPPLLVCPMCDRPLSYQRSHVGGVSSKYGEQWDYFECVSGCGTFQYRARTRKLRKIV
jgi:two-component system, cell cycle response regulator DivK